MQEHNTSVLPEQQATSKSKNQKQARILSALAIGFIGGFVAVGIVSAITAKKFFLILPLLFPLYFVYRIVRKSGNSATKEIVEERDKL